MEKFLQLVFLLMVLGRIQAADLPTNRYTYDLQDWFKDNSNANIDIFKIIPGPHTYSTNNVNPKVWLRTADKESNIISLFDSSTNMPFYTYGSLEKPVAHSKKDFSNARWEVKYPSGLKKFNLPIYDDFTNQNLHIARGHLFPASFASTSEQYAATYQMTNAVAQNDHFNSHGAWREAEIVLLNEGIEPCIKDGGTARMVTGAIPEAEDTKKPLTIHSKAEGRKKMEIQVPGYMWTTMWCLQDDDDDGAKKEDYHVSYIGPNSPEGKVTFFKDFQKFNKEVTGLYGRKDDDLMWDKTIKLVFRDKIKLNNNKALRYGDESDKYDRFDAVQYYTNLYAIFIGNYDMTMSTDVKKTVKEAIDTIKKPQPKSIFKQIWEVFAGKKEKPNKPKKKGLKDEESEEEGSDKAVSAREEFIGRRSG